MNSMTDYYQNKTGLCFEKGIVQADVLYSNKVTIYVPAIMPDMAESAKIDKSKSTQTNIVNVKESTKINKKVNINTRPSYEVIVPEWIASNIRVNGIIKKGQVLYLGFLGGDINSPIVLGAE